MPKKPAIGLKKPKGLVGVIKARKAKAEALLLGDDAVKKPRKKKKPVW